MNISEIERKLIELDRNLHLILEMVREAKEPEEDVVESAVGAWGYDVSPPSHQQAQASSSGSSPLAFTPLPT